MSEVAAIETPIVPMQVRDALLAAWTTALTYGGPVRNSSVALLLAQIGMETGWKSCENFNLGNAKHVAGGSDDYCVFLTEERYQAAQAREVVETTPGATLKTTVPDIDGKLVVELPQMFRAFPDLNSGVEYYLGLLSHRFAGAWPYVLACDPKGFVTKLGAEGYFTAPVREYLADVYEQFGAVSCLWLGFATVEAFQVAHGLTVDDICGPMTSAKMAAVLDAEG